MPGVSWIVSALLFLIASAASAQTRAFVPYPVFDGGGMRMQVCMRGQIGSSSNANEGGLYWPGDGVSSPLSRVLCFSSTPVFIGRINGELRVAASHYRNSFLPGPIIGGAAAVDPTDPLYRAYTITKGQFSDQDYSDWPMALGAPVSNPRVPLFYGRKQMFWVMNDLDTSAMAVNNGSLPLGLEMRCLLYEPWEGAARENTLLLQVTYINKGPERIRDSYAGYFMDMDVRDASNELAGSDSLRGMVYAYSDDVNNEGMPAAMGLVMLQTPVVDAPGERARWFSDWKADARNMPVTAGVLPLKVGGSPISEPIIGSSAEQWYALMRGEGVSDVYVINPATGAPSRFWVSGDPINWTGWQPVHGIPLSNGEVVDQRASDKRVLISAGPFDLAPGDTQQVTYAFIASRGATARAALQDLLDRADFIRADFMRNPIASAYREAYVHPPDSGTVPGVLRVNARFGNQPAMELNVEVRDKSGKLLVDTALIRNSSGMDYLYNRTVAVKGLHQDGVNVSFVAKGNGGQVRIPGRVSLPLDKTVELRWVHMLEEGDGNHRVAPEEEAKWFPYFINNTRNPYRIFAPSYYLPNSQWLNVPWLKGLGTVPSAEVPWDHSMGFNTLWDPSKITSSGEMVYHYDLFDPSENVWWESDYRIPTDTAALDWYDVLMTQVRGTSDERLGVRLLDLAALRDKWYVATITGVVGDRTISLHDSATGVPYFEGYGLDRFTFASPAIDGFRVVRGTVTVPGQNGRTVTENDLFIFNPRHILLAKARNPIDSWAVSYPSPQPLTAWTTVTMDVPEATQLRAEVYNAIGQRVKILREEFVQPGRHLLIWDGYWSDGRPADSGAYLLRIVTRSGEVTRKMMLLR